MCLMFLQDGNYYVFCEECHQVVQNSAINAHEEEHEKSWERARFLGADRITGIATHLVKQIRAVPGVRPAVYIFRVRVMIGNF